jgi:hypothetical protein
MTLNTTGERPVVAMLLAAVSIIGCVLMKPAVGLSRSFINIITAAIDSAVV